MTDQQLPVHIMLDLETTATTLDAGIIGIGAYRMFRTDQEYKSAEFKVLVSVADNEKIGRKIDTETMLWWDKQDSELRDEIFSGTTPLNVALDLYLNWIDDQCPDRSMVYLWANGSEFDNVIMQHAFLHTYYSYPFNFRNHRCFRTLVGIAPPNIRAGLENKRKHDPLSDAIYQGQIAERILGSALGGVGK